MVNIAVFVSGGGTNLGALIDACSRNEINGQIKLVVSSKENAYGLVRASNANIRGIYTKDEKLILTELKKEKIDLIVLAGYLAIVGDDLINEYKNRIINIHPSLIPSFCGPGYYGLHVHKAAFNRGVKVSGATVHFVSNVVDGGPIILQEAIDISSAKSPEEIQSLILTNVEHKLLVKAVSLYCDNKIEVINERVVLKWEER